MAKQNQKQQSSTISLKVVSPEKTFSIPFPNVLLSIVVLFLYFGSLNFGYTDLDDTIFIKELATYNEQVSNLGHSFLRGVFSEDRDTYYRPMLLNSFVINHQLSETNIKGYHGMNLFLHLVAVLLLFAVLRKLRLNETTAFVLTLIFAVHPVLSQAVAWIPGRNDTLLAVFAFSFMLTVMHFLYSRKPLFVFLQFVLLLAALFTKESAMFVIPAFFVLCIAMLELEWRDKRNFLLFASWIIAIGIWFAVRSMASLKDDPIEVVALLKNLPLRVSLIIQYLGKIFLPFNLSVFPMLRETSYLFGVAAIALLIGLIYFAKERNNKIVWAGLMWFVFLLIPLFFLPASINDQDFEHRLYLPIVGILIMLSQSILFKNLPEKKTALIGLSIAAVLFVMNMMHQQKFKDALSFWESAVETTPNSSYANMMLAARIAKVDVQKGEALMRRAYQLNPKEKYVNYYLGKEYLDKNQVDSAEKYLTAELSTSAYFETTFLLSRVAFLKKDMQKSMSYMAEYLEKDKSNSQAINNYVLMLTQSNQYEKAKVFISKKQSEGIAIPQELVDLANQVQAPLVR